MNTDGWVAGPVLHRIEGFTPRLESWDRHDHPNQVRLRAYLDAVVAELGELPAGNLYLHLDVDVEKGSRLERHHDLENYLTPLVRRLGAERFVLVTARKFVEGGSSMVIGEAVAAELPGYTFRFHCARSEFKAEMRQALLDSGAQRLPVGPVEVHQLFRCSSRKNWVPLWKPAGDAMGPVLGEPFPHKPFYPNDDRIVSLTLMRVVDEAVGLEIGLSWSSIGLDDVVAPVPPNVVATSPTPSPSPVVRRRMPGRVIDRMVVLARSLSADRAPIAMRELHTDYCERWPDGPGSPFDSFSATLNYFTVNMRSRFPKPNEKHTDAYWMREPLFQRVRRGRYQLLSESQRDRFFELLAADDERLYNDEYDVVALLGR